MDIYLAEIRLFAGNFAPKNWAFCNGALLAIAQNTALFSLLGTMYGGNGQTTFALPDLRGRVPVSQGTGPGLSNYTLGEAIGTQTNTLIITNMPAHNHPLLANNATGSGTLNNPSGAFMGVGPVDRSSGLPVNTRYSTTANTIMAANSISVQGASQPINNIQPSLGLNYIICIAGIFPSRN
jgi:microcystin-dependent protein